MLGFVGICSSLARAVPVGVDFALPASRHRVAERHNTPYDLHEYCF